MQSSEEVMSDLKDDGGDVTVPVQPSSSTELANASPIPDLHTATGQSENRGSAAVPPADASVAAPTQREIEEAHKKWGKLLPITHPANRDVVRRMAIRATQLTIRISLTLLVFLAIIYGSQWDPVDVSRCM